MRNYYGESFLSLYLYRKKNVSFEIVDYLIKRKINPNQENIKNVDCVSKYISSSKEISLDILKLLCISPRKSSVEGYLPFYIHKSKNLNSEIFKFLLDFECKTFSELSRDEFSSRYLKMYLINNKNVLVDIIRYFVEKEKVVIKNKKNFLQKYLNSQKTPKISVVRYLLSKQSSNFDKLNSNGESSMDIYLKKCEDPSQKVVKSLVKIAKLPIPQIKKSIDIYLEKENLNHNIINYLNSMTNPNNHVKQFFFSNYICYNFTTKITKKKID